MEPEMLRGGETRQVWEARMLENLKAAVEVFQAHPQLRLMLAFRKERLKLDGEYPALDDQVKEHSRQIALDFQAAHTVIFRFNLLNQFAMQRLKLGVMSEHGPENFAELRGPKV